MHFFVLLFLAAGVVHAQKILAVLEINPGQSDDIPMEISEYRHLTDELRTQARKALPKNKYTVLTRDNIIQLIPPDEKEAECLVNACAIEIGRAIGAEYVTQGLVGKFGKMLTITVELYESMSGNLLGSFVTESKDVMGLLATVRKESPSLFVLLSAPPPQSTSQKSSLAFPIAVTFDVLGAAALSFGIYQHINSNKLYKDYKDIPKGEPDKYEPALQKANDAQKLRNIGYTAGAALLATGIAIHVWF